MRRLLLSGFHLGDEGGAAACGATFPPTGAGSIDGATIPEMTCLEAADTVWFLTEIRTVIGGNRHGPRDVQNEHKLQYAA